MSTRDSIPEYATPECDELLDLVACDRAGERIVADLVRRAQRRLPEHGIAGQIRAFKNNTDSAGNSYGCHENYLVSRDTVLRLPRGDAHPLSREPSDLRGGRQGPSRAEGCEYHLSQRALHISDELSGSTVSGRPIINTRDEPHADAGRFRRLHVIVGDSNMSEVTTYLKVGTTALVLDMIEDGYLSKDLRLESPIGALRAISADPLLRERVRLKNGGAYTALELQLTYLEASEDHVRRRGGDPRAAAVLSRWRAVLAQLAADPMGARRDVDWAIKRAVIDRYIERQECSLDDPRVALLDLQYHDVQPARGLYHLLARHGEVDGSSRTSASSAPGPARPRPRGRACGATSSAAPPSRDGSTRWTGLSSGRSRAATAGPSSARIRSSPTTSGWSSWSPETARG